MIKKIAHITDVHLDESHPFLGKTSARKRLDNIIESILENDIHDVVCTGDIGENDGIPYFFNQLTKLNLSITLGNHDSFTKISEHYDLGADYNSGKMYRSVVENAFKLIYLDSSSGIIDDQQMQWLEKELITSKPIVIFVHHPIIGLPLKVDDIGKLENRENLKNIFEKVPNKITIYCGHYHMDSTIAYKNVRQYITPAVAFQIKKDIDNIEIDTTVYGYRIIQLDTKEHSSKVILLHDAD
ncbi:metallophosphoesterase family protein [Aquimarina litoralis]|uniref:metallophosphoesterase family protein n=1 Tax=Aquimarina litoralis TaxID=584605 RepID=UPI001C596428|nr:metallophosphoesterase [Aquimarina litoralis]MBW1294981.1 hypothetical protein [Aquimarina litoralis]